MAAILSIGATFGSCAPRADCTQIVSDHVMGIKYNQSGREKARHYYERYGLLFIIYLSSVDFFPSTGTPQSEVGNSINRSGRNPDYLRLNVQDIDDRCDQEFEEFNSFAIDWNDYMYSRLH